MRTESATTTFTRSVTVAAGVFAPGHLGELTQYLPFELVDDILAQTKTVQRRLRDLRRRLGPAPVKGAPCGRVACGDKAAKLDDL